MNQTTSERISFRQINKKTGNRLRQQLIDEVTREPVENEDKGQGYEYAKNTYLVIDDEELEALKIDFVSDGIDCNGTTGG